MPSKLKRKIFRRRNFELWETTYKTLWKNLRTDQNPQLRKLQPSHHQLRHFQLHRSRKKALRRILWILQHVRNRSLPLPNLLLWKCSCWAELKRDHFGVLRECKVLGGVYVLETEGKSVEDVGDHNYWEVIEIGKGVGGDTDIVYSDEGIYWGSSSANRKREGWVRSQGNFVGRKS